MKRTSFRRPEFYVSSFASLALLYAVVLGERHLQLANWCFRSGFSRRIIGLFGSIDPLYQFLILAVETFLFYFFLTGLGLFFKWKKYQRALDCLSLQNGLGETPQIVSVDCSGPHRLKLSILSEGLALDRYEMKKADLEAACGIAIESIRQGKSPRFVEVALTTHRLPDVCHYRDLVTKLAKPYSFLVGESIGGLVMQSIRDLPHMLAAGTSGKGKSVFLTQAVLGLAQTSPYFQMYVSDLKRGVESKELSILPNVVVAKDEAAAVKILRLVEDEMKRRFDFLEKSKFKKIEPERDKLDLITVVVDEASVLYTVPSKRTENSKWIIEAREVTERLAKLGRAAGIHLILATQKVTKETIDTRIQENITGRICFRVNSIQGSAVVLGNKMAAELPDHPGRAIWNVGNKFIEVQSPMITESEIERVCQEIKFEFDSGKRKNFQPMLTVYAKKDEDPDPGEVVAAA